MHMIIFSHCDSILVIEAYLSIILALYRSYCMPFLKAFKFYIDICTLPKASGLCEETLPRWYFDYTETRCMPFNYTGCDGNANRFMSRGECEATCAQDDTGIAILNYTM
ncbi:Papilin [Armadillidium vulgare]|nr:Papilin [Armadillidium vulgare]